MSLLSQFYPNGVEKRPSVSAPIQINNLRYVLVHRFSLFWAVLEAKCATKCATAAKLCNRQKPPLAELSQQKYLDNLEDDGLV